MAGKKKRNRNRKKKKTTKPQKIIQMAHYLFTPIDSWFFKESRSMDSSGTNRLVSLFPPSSKTLLGAIRSQIGEKYHQVNKTTWHDFKSKSHSTQKLLNKIGYANDYAKLQAQGVWLYYYVNNDEPDNNEKGELFFPAPANLLSKQEQGVITGYSFFSMGGVIKSDLGTVRFAQLDYENEPSTLQDHFISQTELSKVLNGQLPDYTTAMSDIVFREPRLGIARDNKTHQVEEGKLYQTEHIRVDTGWSVYLGLTKQYLKQDLPNNNTPVRLGGEGRMALLSRTSKNMKLPNSPSCQHIKTDVGLIIYLMTPLPDYRHNNKKPPLPNASFEKDTEGLWNGTIAGVNICIETAIIGKLIRQGGWDMVNHKPQAVKSHIPAGSCWYIKAQGSADAQKVIDKLHKKYLTEGNDRALGYGQMAIGLQPLNT